MGWSDPSPRPRTVKVMAGELHRLLQNAGITGPYVLVGHSFGGLIVRMFASLYRDERSALVLVDSVVPHEFPRLPRSVTTYNNHFLRVQTWKEDTMFFGLPRLMGWCGNGPATLRSALRTMDCRSGPWKEHMAEYETADESSDQVLKARPLGDLPVVIISEDLHKGNVWNALQAGLIQISTDSCRMIAKRSGHMIPTERPRLIADVVRDLVDRLRTRQAPPALPVETVLKEFGCAH